MSNIDFANFNDAGSSSSDFPTTTTADQTSLWGVSKALAAVPVAAKRSMPTAQDVLELPAGMPGLGQQGGLDIRPMEAVLNDFDLIDPQSRAAIQNSLYQAGFYSSSYYGNSPPMIVPGENDSGSRAAWKAAVEEASRSSVYDPQTHTLVEPKTVEEVINDRIKNRQAQGLGDGSAAKAKTLTHPDDLRAVIRNVATNVIGRRPDAAVEENFIAAFHNAEAQAGQSDGAGNVIAGPQDVSAIAEQYLQHAYPQEAYDNGFLGAFDSFRKMIGGGSGG